MYINNELQICRTEEQRQQKMISFVQKYLSIFKGKHILLLSSRKTFLKSLKNSQQPPTASRSLPNSISSLSQPNSPAPIHLIPLLVILSLITSTPLNLPHHRAMKHKHRYRHRCDTATRQVLKN